MNINNNLNSFFNSDPNKNDVQDKSSSHFLKDILIPVGSLLIAAISFLALNGKLPTWAIVAIAAYLIIIAIYVSMNPLIQLFILFLEKQRKKKAAKKFFPSLQDIAKEFAPLIDINSNRSDTMLYLLNEINGWNESQNNMAIQSESEHINTIQNWFASIKKRLDLYRLKDFSYLATDLSDLIFQYHRFCIRAQRQLETLVTAKKLSEQQLRHLKQEWNLRREKHNQIIIQNWDNLAKKINETFAERICVEVYEPLKTLE
jgi:hypothetical protein